MQSYVLNQRLSAAVKWGLFLLLPLPLYISSSMLFPFITGRNFGFRIILEILAIGWVGLLVLSSNYRPRLTPLVKSVLIFLFIVTLADILGANPYRSFWSNYERMEGLLAILHLVLFFLMASSLFKKLSDWKIYFYASTAVSVVVSYTALLQKLGYTQSLQGGVRVDGTIGNPAYLASYLMFHVFFLLFFLWRERQQWLRWSATGVIFFELYIIYLTATRGVILAMVAVAGLLAVYFAARKPAERREAALRRLALIALVVGAVLIGSFIAFRNSRFVTSSPILGRFATISAEERTVQSRFLIWKMAWEGVKERPILGWGQENFYLVFNKFYNPKLWSSEPWFDRSHNVFLDWTIHAGLLGLAAYLAMLFFGLQNIWRAWKSQRLSFYEAGILAGLFGVYFFQNLFVFDNFQSYFLLFLTLGFTDYLAHAEAAEKNAGHEALFRKETALGASGLAGVVIIFALYFLNLRPILASQQLIVALQSANQSASVKAIQTNFQNVIDYGTFGSGEAREQLSSLARNVLGATNRGSPEEIKAFSDFTLKQLEVLTASSAVDVKHLLLLASFYNALASTNPDYAGQAVDLLQRAIALSSTKQPIYFELANAKLQSGDGQGAVDLMKQVIVLDPSFPSAHLNAAIVGALAGSNEFAVAEASEYLRLAPNPDKDTRERLINIYLRANDLGAIKQLIENAIQQNPPDAELYARYAAILAALGDKEGAKAAARRAAELNSLLQGEVEKFIKEVDSGKPR